MRFCVPDFINMFLVKYTEPKELPPMVCDRYLNHTIYECTSQTTFYPHQVSGNVFVSSVTVVAVHIGFHDRFYKMIWKHVRYPVSGIKQYFKNVYVTGYILIFK